MTDFRPTQVQSTPILLFWGTMKGLLHMSPQGGLSAEVVPDLALVIFPAQAPMCPSPVHTPQETLSTAMVHGTSNVLGCLQSFPNSRHLDIKGYV